MRFFNKDSDVTYSEFSKGRMLYPDLKICAWVELNDLPKDEQSENAKQMGGLLKTLTYKEAGKNIGVEQVKKIRNGLQNYQILLQKFLRKLRV